MKRSANVFRVLAGTAVVLACTVLAKESHAQFTTDELKCRQTIAKSGAKLAGTIGKVQSRCHKDRLKGKVPVTTECNDTAQADTKNKIQRTKDKLRDRVAGPSGKCTGFNPASLSYYNCPAPCDALVPSLSDFTDVGECVICLVETAVSEMESMAQGAPTPPVSKDDGKCHRTIGKRQNKHLAVILKERTKCQKREEKNGATTTTTCSGADPKGKITAARTNGENGIATSCTAAVLAAVDSCSVVSISELQMCLFSDSDTRGEEIFQMFYSLGNASWTQVMDVFATTGCNSPICHGGIGAFGGLGGLDDFNAGHANLVNAPVQCLGSSFALRVVPGDSASSFLMAKLDGTHDCGVRMPFAGPPLSNTDRNAIRDWIDAGAPKD